MKRCKAYVEGSFYYGVWKVCYSKSKAGLVAYNCIFDESRYKTLKGLTVTAIAVLAITTVASGGAAIPYYVLAI